MTNLSSISRAMWGLDPSIGNRWPPSTGTH
jgi:hypothetical protein